MPGCSVVGTVKKAVLSRNIYNLRNNVMFYYRTFHPSVAMIFSLSSLFFCVLFVFFGCLVVVSAFWFLYFHSWVTWASISWGLQFRGFFCLFVCFAHPQQCEGARIELSIALPLTSKELCCCLHTRQVLLSTYGPPKKSAVAPVVVCWVHALLSSLLSSHPVRDKRLCTFTADKERITLQYWWFSTQINVKHFVHSKRDCS